MTGLAHLTVTEVPWSLLLVVAGIAIGLGLARGFGR